MRVLALVFLLAAAAIASSNGNNRIHRSSLSALTLRAGAMTTGRRLPPVPQLRCVGEHCLQFASHIRVVKCVVVGQDGMNWKCEAEMPKEVQFTTTDVICEGYDHKDDPFIFDGSCGLEYGLQRTTRVINRRANERDAAVGNILAFLFLIFMVMAVLMCCCRPSPPPLADPHEVRHRRREPTPPSSDDEEEDDQDDAVARQLRQRRRPATRGRLHSRSTNVYVTHQPVPERVYVVHHPPAPACAPVCCPAPSRPRSRSPSPAATHVSKGFGVTKGR
jgi:hypothetical protein